MKKSPIKLWISLLGISFLFACQSPVKLTESGDYDRAIEKAVRKLSGKQKKKSKHVMALETAFRKANARDLNTIKTLKKSSRPDRWDKVVDLYERINRRQNRVIPLIPLIDETGYRADFALVKVGSYLEETRQKAAEFHYVTGKKLLEKANAGDRFAAREAFDRFERARGYFANYKNTRQLIRRAQDLGTTFIKVEVNNQSRAILPRDFSEALMSFSTADMNSLWKEYHVNPDPRITYDYEVRLNIEHIEVSPEFVRERSYIDEKEIEDGWDYVFDANGNVTKDTAGNDIKVPRTIVISAAILEVYQSKEATLQGTLEMVDLRNGSIVHREAIIGDAIFENYASTFEGDRRALSRESRNRIGNTPLPFPTDAILLLDVAERMKPVVKSKIVNNRMIL